MDYLTKLIKNDITVKQKCNFLKKKNEILLIKLIYILYCIIPITIKFIFN